MEILKSILLLVAFIVCGMINYYLGARFTENEWAIKEREFRLKSAAREVEMLNRGMININGIVYTIDKAKGVKNVEKN